MGGSDSIRGYMVQAVVCMLDALLTDKQWHSLTLEPNQGNTQVDFIWHSDSRKQVTQVKSSLKFNAAHVRAAAEELEGVEADGYELILVGHNFGGVRNGQEFGRVVVRLIHLDAVDLKVRAADALDIYLTERGYPNTSNDFRKTAAAVLTEYLLTSSVDSRTLQRKELDDLILLRLLPLLSSQSTSDIAREVREMQEFKALFGVEEPNVLTRRAVMDFYRRTSMFNKHRVIRDAREYLATNDVGHLAVRIGKVQSCFNSFFLCFAVLLMLIPLGFTPFMFSVKSTTLFNIMLGLSLGCELLGFWILITVNPFIQALRIRKEINSFA